MYRMHPALATPATGRFDPGGHPWHLRAKLGQPPLEASRVDRLPIDPLLPELTRAVRETGRLVLEAPPGAGKTTRVPPALLDAGIAGQVLVLEPRRLAARLAATRVASERRGRLGDEVGYQVRFERVAGKKTRILFLTEGLFVRRLQDDPSLNGVGAVLLDELHERHLHTDVALALLRRLREGPRPDLAVVAMSATLDADPVAAYLQGAPILRSEGRRFEVEIDHLERPDDRHLDQQVVSAVRRLVNEGLDGDVLVFLPGAAEIRRSREALAGYAAHADLEVVMLHGQLPARDQDRALAPSQRRKVILSTNVAESSITIDGVVAVVDSGLHRVAGHGAFSGLPTLEVAKISRASATQRAGRAGRTGPGRCLRLYTAHDLGGRPDHDAPEIRRLDLAETVLSLAGLGIPDPAALAWLEAPPTAALDAARALLRDLGAVDDAGVPTATGRTLLGWPVHPRLGTLLLEAAARGVFADACTVAALLGERDLVARGPGRGGPRGATLAGPSDLLDRLDRFAEAERAGFDPSALRRQGLDPGAARAVDRARRQLLRRRPEGARPPLAEGPEAEDALRHAVLAAWPDRVARRRRPGAPELLLAGGTEVVLSETSVVRDAELMVAVDARERKGPRGATTVVDLASAIEADWLLDLFPERITDGVEAEWNGAAGRVDAFSRMRYGAVVLAESRVRAEDHPEAARILAEQALKAGVQAYADPERLADLAGRLRLAASVAPDAGFFELDDAAIRAAVERLCLGHAKLADLAHGDLVEALLGGLSWEARRDLDRLAPTAIALPGRKRVPVHYPEDAPPYVASRIQDFFGLAETPRVGGGQVPLQVRLLAPNRRPVQITQDLAGFWTRHYPEIRRELSRRYPKHRWPETPG